MTDLDTAVCLVYTGPSKIHKEKAAERATQLCLPFVESLENPYGLHLVYTGNRLELQYNPFVVRHKQHPVYVDFLHGSSIHRRLSGFMVSNPLAKAVGVKPNYRPSVVDATAGFGMDGLCLAWIGCTVVLFERNPIIYALLEDGLRRATQNPELSKIIDERITLIREDAISTLTAGSLACDTIFLDPMYPEDRRKTLNRKEMRIIRQLVGDDSDHMELFESALQAPSKRVAVKRPKGALTISPSPLPSFSVTMKSGRFDVYVNHHL